jgi:phosphatidylserine decarboxylase
MIHPKIQPCYHVAKGEELGYFQFGGSTHCLVFRPGAIAGFSRRRSRSRMSRILR